MCLKNYYISHCCCNDCLKLFGMTTLEYRHLQFDLIMVSKIIRILIHVNFHDFLYAPASSINLRHHSFTQKLSVIFNSTVEENCFLFVL